MIEIIGNKDWTVFYSCDCGIKGRCMIKPLEEGGVIVTNITCPLCFDSKVVKFVQYEESKEEATSTNKVSWACVVENEVTDYELKEDL